MPTRQHEMLVNHSNSRGNGIGGRPPNAFFPINQNLPRVRTEDTVKHLHRCGFARAIFADDPVNAPSFNAQVDSIISDARPEALSQSTQFDCWKWAGHFRRSVGICRTESIFPVRPA